MFDVYYNKNTTVIILNRYYHYTISLNGLFFLCFIEIGRRIFGLQKPWQPVNENHCTDIQRIIKNGLT